MKNKYNIGDMFVDPLNKSQDRKQELCSYIFKIEHFEDNKETYYWLRYMNSTKQDNYFEEKEIDCFIEEGVEYLSVKEK